MKITISNIAWNVDEDKNILRLLKKYSVSGVEIAPTKIWKNPIEESNRTINSYRKYWEGNEIRISSTQSILFNHPELSIFGNKDTKKQTLKYLGEMIRVSKQLGAEAIVFGSPKNRNRVNINMSKAYEIASEFFLEIAEISSKYNIYFCIEPNPIEYGTNFINNTKQAIKLVKMVNHPNFRLHLDSGVMLVNGEDVEQAIIDGFPYLRHFHISDKNLKPVVSNKSTHLKIVKTLKSLNYQHWVSIEVRGENNAANADTVDKVLRFVSGIYSDN